MPPEVLHDDVPARALAVFAHPDDPEVACAGTLARWVDGGAEVRLVVCNAGDKGSTDPDADPAQVASIRADEVEAAAAVLGIAGFEILGIPDGELENDAAFREALVARIRSLRPDTVIAPDPTAVFFGDNYINHRDHRELGWAVLDAVAPAAGTPLYFPAAGPPHAVRTLLLSGTLEPDAWVDVTAGLDRKISAVRCHQSRVGEEPDLVADVLRERAADAGRRVGVRFAEAYRRLQF